MRSAAHRIRMFGVFMCVVCVFYAVLFASPNLRKKSEMLYYNDEKSGVDVLVNAENT